MLFIVNPISGKGSKSHICSRLEKSGRKVVYTGYPGHADGEWFEAGTEIEVHVIPGVLSVLVPHK